MGISIFFRDGGRFGGFVGGDDFNGGGWERFGFDGGGFDVGGGVVDSRSGGRSRSRDWGRGDDVVGGGFFVVVR